VLKLTAFQKFFNYGFFDTEDKELKIKSYVFNQSLSSYIASQLKQDRNEITRYVKKEVDDKSFDAGSYNRTWFCMEFIKIWYKIKRS
jgi:hypothetical protein